MRVHIREKIAAGIKLEKINTLSDLTAAIHEIVGQFEHTSVSHRDEVGV